MAVLFNAARTCPPQATAAQVMPLRPLLCVLHGERARLRRGRSRTRKSMKSLPKLCVAATSLLVVSASYPAGPVKEKRSSLSLFAGTEEPPEIARLVERACQNCHSERTEWPWYSYVAPMSWMIEKDVSNARTHMNLSRWQDYTVEQQIDLLTRLAVEVRNRKMPLPRYLKMHSEARLSAEDVQQFYSWAHSERKRLKAADTKGKAFTD